MVVRNSYKRLVILVRVVAIVGFVTVLRSSLSVIRVNRCPTRFGPTMLDSMSYVMEMASRPNMDSYIQNEWVA